jgi:hypothetical protein
VTVRRPTAACIDVISAGGEWTTTPIWSGSPSARLSAPGWWILMTISAAAGVAPASANRQEKTIANAVCISVV